MPPNGSPTPNTYTPDLFPPEPSPSGVSPIGFSTPKVYYTQPTTQTYQPTPPKVPTREYNPQYPDGTSNTNEYLPPDGTSIVSTAIPPKPYSPQVPDSNIININVLKPDVPLRPEGAGTSESRLRPPTSRPVTEYPFKGDLNTTPYPGCAAALKCVEAQFCSADGVISSVPVVLTKEQEIMRVPTTVSI